MVVQWDRWAAGKSYREDISSTLTTEQLVADTVELTNVLRARFHQDKIYLVGHSWGTYLGMLVIARRPELYHAYVGLGQLARSSPIAGIQDEYIRQSARRIGDQDALKEMEDNGASVREALPFKFGGELHKKKSFMPLLLTGLAAFEMITEGRSPESKTPERNSEVSHRFRVGPRKRNYLAIRRRTTLARPINPVPSSVSVPGSGTCAGGV